DSQARRWNRVASSTAIPGAANSTTASSPSTSAVGRRKVRLFSSCVRSSRIPHPQSLPLLLDFLVEPKRRSVGTLAGAGDAIVPFFDRLPVNHKLLVPTLDELCVFHPRHELVE